MEKILILQDKRGYTAGSLLPEAHRKIDGEFLKKELEKQDMVVEIKNLHELVFPTQYKGWYIVYPSSEDAGLFYKEYIEDILLRLTLEGAILLPRFELFRAHHNKVFMELYRTILSEEYNSIQSVVFYGADDLEKKLSSSKQFPIVMKTSEGAGSSGVSIAHNKKEAVKKAKKMGNIIFYGNYYSRMQKLRHILGRLHMKLKGEYYIDTPKIQEKMVYQTLIPNLSCDYKVLVFGKKYYLLRRKVRKNDFRASGSGKLEFPEEFTDIEREVLTFAKKAYEQLHTPLLSIDIAHDGKKCHMIEFQCLNFGPYTLQFSECYYVQDNYGGWSRLQGNSILEEEMAKAYSEYVKGNSVK